MHFTLKNIIGLQETVGRYHFQFILEQAGIDALLPNEKKFLQSLGVDLAKYKGKRTPIEESYWFGKMENQARKNKSFNRLDLKQFRQFLNQNPELFKLTKEDKATLKLQKQAFASDIRRLMGDIKADLHQTLVEVSQVATVEKLSKKSVLKIISGKLATNTKRYSGRMELISGYRCHETFQQGISQEILQRLGPNAKCYYSLHPQACEHCKRTYLLKNGQPRIFLLKTLIKNGNNIGRKAKEYLPSLAPLHPRCRCKLNQLPKGRVKFSVKQNQYIHF